MSKNWKDDLDEWLGLDTQSEENSAERESRQDKVRLARERFDQLKERRRLKEILDDDWIC